MRLPAAIRTHPDVCAVAVLLIVSIATRVRHLARPFHGDEMITFSNMVLSRDLGGIVFGPYDSNSHLLNSLIMKTVHLGFGEVPALMRLPNLIFVLLAVVLVYLASVTSIGRGPAFAAALLFSLHPAMVLFSVSSRGYAGMVLFTLISSVLFLQLPRSFSWWRWFGCLATGFLAGTAHLFAANALIAQILLALVMIAVPAKTGSETLAARARRLGPVVLAPLSALTMLIALALPQLRLSRTESFNYPFQTDFPTALINFMGGTTYRTDLDGISVALAAFALAGLFGLSINRTLKFFLGVLFLSPIALYGLSYFAPVFTLHPRFFVYLLPFYCLLLVVGMNSAAEAVRAKTNDRGLSAIVARSAVWLFVIAVAVIFTVRIHVPSGGVFVHPQALVGEFVKSRPEAHFLTNDPGFVRVRLRQEANMDRILPALGIKPIRAYQAERPTIEIFFIYVPKKRLTEADLVHYQGEVAPEVLYQRDDRMKMYLTRNAALELDAGPRVQIYALGSRPSEGIEIGSVN